MRCQLHLTFACQFLNLYLKLHVFMDFTYLFLKLSILFLIKENKEPCSKPPPLENDLPLNLWGALRNHTIIWDVFVICSFFYTCIFLFISIFKSAKSLRSFFCFNKLFKIFYLFSILLI